jgi:hypothetical protein
VRSLAIRFSSGRSGLPERALPPARRALEALALVVAQRLIDDRGDAVIVGAALESGRACAVTASASVSNRLGFVHGVTEQREHRGADRPQVRL